MIAPSPIPYVPTMPTPRAMTRVDMDAVHDAFVAAARRGIKAGFDLLELHCAHGYLLSAFISPLTNRRDDEYGARSRTGCGIRSKSSTPCGPCGPRLSR